MSTDTAKSAFSRWAAPALGVVAGIVYLIIMIVRGEPILGFILLGIMLVYVAIIVGLSKRSEAGALLRGSANDERQREIGTRAGAITGHALTMGILGGALYTMATGSSAFAIWAGLAALGGGTFLVATLALSRWS